MSGNNFSTGFCKCKSKIIQDKWPASCKKTKLPTSTTTRFLDTYSLFSKMACVADMLLRKVHSKYFKKIGIRKELKFLKGKRLLTCEYDRKVAEKRVCSGEDDLSRRQNKKLVNYHRGLHNEQFTTDGSICIANKHFVESYTAAVSTNNNSAATKKYRNSLPMTETTCNEHFNEFSTSVDRNV